MNRQCLLAMLLWLSVLNAAAADDERENVVRDDQAAFDYQPALARFRRLGAEQGLSQVSAWALAQDRHGFLWIGTQDGLNRFDGNEFRVYRNQPDAPDSLAGNHVQALAIDHQGVLWVGSNGGLSRYHEANDRFESVPITGESEVQAEVRGLHVDDAGVLWIASYAGLSRYDPKTGQRTVWVFPADHTPRDSRFESLSSDRQGHLWLGSLGGLSRLDPATGKLDWPFDDLRLAEPLEHTRIDALLRDRQGVIWIGTVAEGLFRYDENTGLRVFRHRDNDPDSLDSDIIRSLLEDRHGRLWVGTREGLNRMTSPADPASTFARFGHYRHDPRSLGPGRVMSLLEAQDGSLLAGTYTGGVSILSERGNRFTSFTPDSAATAGLRDPVIYSLLTAGPDAVWLGGRKGLYHFDMATGELRDFPATAALGVSALAVEDDSVWIGVLAGAGIVSPADGRLRKPALPSDLAGVQITALLPDGDRLVAGTFDRGIHVLQRDTLAPLAHYPIASWVSQISRFDDHTLLVCASDGLHWLSRDGEREIFFHRADSEPGAALPTGGITYFLRARNGTLWLASASAGLLRMQLDAGADPSSARFEPVIEVSRAGLDVVQALAEDPQDRLWLSTTHGIASYDPRSHAVTRYGAADGAFDSDYQSAAVAQLPDGRLVFAATRGFTVFDPDSIHDTPATPPPLLTELRLWNRHIEPASKGHDSPLSGPLHQAQQLAIPATDARMLSLRFSTVALPAPERLRYAYRLEGFDQQWLETNASERSATYTNLPPGRYQFRVKAGEPGTLDNAAITRLTLDILPPWWQTLWARALFTLAALAALSAGYHWRVRSIEAHRRALKRLVAERTAELSAAKQRAEQALVDLRTAQRELVESEKMASLGSLVSGIAHEINTPLGVAVTASSLLGDRTVAMKHAFNAGELKRSDLAAFFDMAREATALVDSNLDRAAQLVSRFKQISLDHNADQRREIELASHLKNLLNHLQMDCEDRLVHFELACEAPLMIDSYPGAISQVIGNLVQNSLVHAFNDGEIASIRIAAEALPDGRIELRVTDKGRGIAADDLSRVFEPFYTTKRGRGGAGLGLHLVYTLVTARLGGQIEIHSSPAGTQVIVRIPRTAK